MQVSFHINIIYNFYLVKLGDKNAFFQKVSSDNDEIILEKIFKLFKSVNKYMNLHKKCSNDQMKFFNIFCYRINK